MYWRLYWQMGKRASDLSTARDLTRNALRYLRSSRHLEAFLGGESLGPRVIASLLSGTDKERDQFIREYNFLENLAENDLSVCLIVDFLVHPDAAFSPPFRW